VAILAAGGHDPVAHLDVGVALQVAETPWAQARARLATWETQAVQVTRRRVRWGGRRVDSAAREVTAAGWQDHGEIDWLITSLRLVGRAQADGELISIWWSGLAGAQVDPAGDAVDLDGSKAGGDTSPVRASPRSRSQRSPPATARKPCRVHRGLARLRRPATETEAPPAPEPLPHPRQRTRPPIVRRLRTHRHADG